MARKLVSVTLDNASELPLPCRTCTWWERGERAGGGDSKDDWLSAVLLDWGSCGRMLCIDGEIAGFALYAPAAYVVGAPGVVTRDVSADAVLLMTARILPQYAGAGLGRVLIQSVVKDAFSHRGVKAVEAFGDTWVPRRRIPTGAKSALAAQENDSSGKNSSGSGSGTSEPLSCVLPADFLSAVGFKTVQHHPRYPRFRLELRSVLSWRSEVELALERWLGAIRPERAASPLGVAPRTDPASLD
ncbi:MAG: GNAT family N-acetyltransferase [Nocardioidaceae bacterium]